VPTIATGNEALAASNAFCQINPRSHVKLLRQLVKGDNVGKGFANEILCAFESFVFHKAP
jgi:hypothetical protein